MTRDINHEVTKVKNLELRLSLGVGTTQQGAHAGDELARREGLDEVVICPQLEADDAILDLALGSEHRHRAQAAGGSPERQARADQPNSSEDHLDAKAALMRDLADATGTPAVEPSERKRRDFIIFCTV